MVHYLKKHIIKSPNSQYFTNPFDYTPNTITKLAAKKLQKYLETQKKWGKEMEKGKMFGVLIVEDSEHRLGYIAAFSGSLGGKNTHQYFVPPIFDILDPTGYFTQEASEISILNAKVVKQQNSTQYRNYNTKIEKLQKKQEKELTESKKAIKLAKTQRQQKKENNTLSNTEIQTLNTESQHEKAEHKRLEKQHKLNIETLELGSQNLTLEVRTLKEERMKRSGALQQWLFEQYIVRNAKGKTQNLIDIFKETPQKIPPAAAGECAAPKLLQYAFNHSLKPIAMAEFWWGRSPKGVVRHHLNYYPACKGKCAPILGFMLKGLKVEPAQRSSEVNEVNIAYEDEALMIAMKPEGVLCVPGKSNEKSLYDTIKELYINSFEPLMVHRLDMATSGLLLIAKNKEVHKILQKQFAQGEIKKRYIALLENTPPQKSGHIELPLAPDYNHRPAQKVDHQKGKPSTTRYEVIGMSGEYTKVALYPLTGRTHQLRIHCAHKQGLNAPIVGDKLYGKSSAKRLYLHAEELTFEHPISGKLLTINRPCDF